jgi:hypothetical protein
MSNLVGAPSRKEFETGPAGIGHQIAPAENVSIWAFIKGQETSYPLLTPIIRYQYKDEGEFELNREGQDSLKRETALLAERITHQRDSGRAATLLREFAAEVRKVNPSYNLQGLSVEEALAGLDGIREFIEEVQKRGWLLFGVTD